MALMKCKECGHQISTTAKSCPNCGAKPDRWGFGSWLIAILVVTVGFVAVVNVLTDSTRQQAQVAVKPAAKTPKQKAQDEKHDLHVQAAASGAVALKNAMKDPESFQLKSLVVKPNGAACYEYRAKNSFGAILPSQAVLTPGRKFLSADQDGFANAWNRHCTVAGGEEVVEIVKRLRAFSR